jgi:hypothetical protein
MADIIQEKKTEEIEKITGPLDEPVRQSSIANSELVTTKRQSLSDIFTIFCAGFALLSDGYQNSLMYDPISKQE